MSDNQQKKHFFEDSLFMLLKVIGNKDIRYANLLYKKYLKGRYIPSPYQNHSTRPYLMLYKLLGFKGAEMARRILGK